MQRFSAAASSQRHADHASAVISRVYDPRRDVGDETAPLVAKHLHGQDAAVRADARDADAIVCGGRGDARDMGSMSETVLDTAHVALLADALRRQVRVEAIDTCIDDSENNTRITERDVPRGGRRDGAGPPLGHISIV